MNDFDGETEEVTSYVRQRMSGDLPPSFVEDVMKNVVDMPQRRRSWLGSPLIAGIATIAAAVAVVGIGLSTVSHGRFGTDETPTPSPTGSPSATATPGATATPFPSRPGTVSALPAPSAEAGGAYGPTWQMNPDEAFQSATTCENLSGLPTNEGGPNPAYRISMPGDWFHYLWVGDCMLFAPEPFQPDMVEPTGPPAHWFAGYWVPEAAAIWILVESGGNFVPDGSVISTEEYTVDGVPAIRYEILPEEGGVATERSVVWIVGVLGRLPSDAIDAPPYLAISTASNTTVEFETFVHVLDRMVATLVVLAP